MAEEMVKVTLPSVQMVDDKVYFAGEVEVPESVARKLEGQLKAKEEAVAATGNPEAAPLTKEAAGPTVTVGNPAGKKGKGSSDTSGSEDEE